MIEVNGQVADATTGQGIPSATIAVNGVAVGAADGTGNFTVNLNSYNDTITASSIGYAPLTVPAYQVQESGIMQLGIDAQSLQAVTVTPTVTAKKNYTPWLILAGVVVVAGSSSHRNTMSGTPKASTLLPIALLGLGAYFLLKPSASSVVPSSTATAPYAPVTGSSATTAATTANSALSSLSNIFKGLFGGSSSSTPGAASFVPVGVQPVPGTTAPSSPASNYPTLPGTAPTIPISPGAYDGDYTDIEDYADELSMMGVGVGDSSSTFSAGDIIGKTLIAAQQVPVYNSPGDSQTPVGYIDAGNPVGIVTSWLDPNPDEDRAELWWTFNNNNVASNFGNSLGDYFVPHKAGYFDVQALVDQGVLTAAEATALQQGNASDSTWDTLIKKYGPWILGGLVAIGLGKAVINKIL